MDPSKIDWGDSLGGFVTGAVTVLAGMFNWFGKKLREVHKRIDVVEGTIGGYAVHIGQQKEQHKANQQQFQDVKHDLNAINQKQDRQMEILLQINRK